MPAMEKKRIIILANMAKAAAVEQVDALRDWFEQRVEIVAVLPANEPVAAEAGAVDLCVVFGGDGTLLAAARAVAPTGTPLLGVNVGKLGFLAEFSVEDLQKHFDQILAGQVEPVERMMLQVCVTDRDKHRFSSLAANEVAISAGQPFRVIDLAVTQGGKHVAQYLCDGLVVSTATGSTAYNMSAGGPILEPTIDAIAITPVAPHALAMRPIVVRSDRAVRITATGVNPGTTVSIDGQLNSPLREANAVEVRRADTPARIISHPERSFFDTLTDKLHWARSPHHTS